MITTTVTVDSDGVLPIGIQEVECRHCGWTEDLIFPGEMPIGLAGTQNGYGIFAANTDGHNTVKAHRWIYDQMVEEILPGFESDHLCRTRNCVNYERHLEPVTKKENWRRSRPWRDHIWVRDDCGRFRKEVISSEYA